ncbi:response regulator transcription factor [Quadrisphaera sp. DSM 44207]|uniref:helix-turn-helix transcriptional regulator n=1 Tax=Quadrisphaera sp. DSM 44207 TaxID=1881057 RepID=UPI000882391A|nr:response regulator transcription factor [Quadrisphaera sp. DSM 44207]SDQ49529.1 two component transcriptional regulator, LuxR family [Quadrisphaera sp. DSM 44207]
MSTVVERGAVRAAPAPRGRRSTALVAVQTLAAREIAVRVLRALGTSEVLAASTVLEARRAAAAHTGDACVVEAGLQDGAGISLVRDLRAAGWSPAVVVSTTEDPWMVRAALAAGVRCFVSTPASGTVAPVLPSTPEGLQNLSGREVEVLQLVADGQSNREVGDALGLSALTVKSHLARIARKLGTGDRAEMVLVCLRAGVIS